MRIIGIIGAGRFGQTIARLALAAGFVVRLAGSGAPVRVGRIVEMYAPGAEPAWASDAAASDVVVLALPLSDALELEPQQFAGRLVLDATNYWPETDGVRADLDDPADPTSAQVQRRLPFARVVKALNHVAYRDLASRAQPAGSPHRIAVGLSGDDATALAEAAAFVDAIGFDPVPVGTLAGSTATEPRSDAFGAVLDADGLRRRLAAQAKPNAGGTTTATTAAQPTQTGR